MRFCKRKPPQPIRCKASQAGTTNFHKNLGRPLLGPRAFPPAPSAQREKPPATLTPQDLRQRIRRAGYLYNVAKCIFITGTARQFYPQASSSLGRKGKSNIAKTTRRITREHYLLVDENADGVRLRAPTRKFHRHLSNHSRSSKLIFNPSSRVLAIVAPVGPFIIIEALLRAIVISPAWAMRDCVKRSVGHPLQEGTALASVGEVR